jgi:hypothetical protein
MRSISIGLILIAITSLCVIGYAENRENYSFLNDSQYKELKDFSNKIREINAKKEKEGISTKEVERILGKPNHKNDASIEVDGGKEVWHYWHPCYASVRYLLVFNELDQLILFTSAQMLNPKIGDHYYDIDKFLIDKTDH